MKRKSFKFTLLASAMLAAMTLTSCTSNDDNPVDTTPTTPTEQDIFANMEKISAPAYISDVTNAYLKEAIDRRFTNQTALNNAQIAVVTPQEIGTYDGQLKELYDRGGLIVILKPNMERYRAFVEKYGIKYGLPAVDDDREMLLFAFNNMQQYYTIFAQETPSPLQVTETELDDDGNAIGEDSYEITPDVAYDVAYYVDQMDLFATWTNEHYSMLGARTRSSKDGFSEEAFLASEEISGNYSFTLSARGYKETEEKLTKTAKISYRFDVYPLYVFEVNGDNKRGDYYKVDATITAHNDQSWELKHFERTGSDDYNVGFFLRKLNVDFAMANQAGVQWPASFFSDPEPETTPGAMTYTSSKTMGINASLSGGLMGPNPSITGAAGFNASWTQGTSQTLQDVQTNRSFDTDGSIRYEYVINNITVGKTDYDEHWEEWLNGDFSKTSANVPAESRTTLTLKSTWVWRDDYAGDNDSYSKRILMHVNPVYGSWYYRHGKSPNEVTIQGVKKTVNTEMAAPNRQPFGVLGLRNASTAYALGNIKVWRQTDGDSSTPVATISGESFSADEKARIKLPVGTYRVKYDFINGNTNQVVSHWKVENISIKNGSTADNSETTVSTVNGVEVK